MAHKPPVPGAGVVTVKYDNHTPWGEAVPYVQFEREPIFYGGKWGQVANITLSGQVSQYSYDASKTLQAAGTFTPTLEWPDGVKNLEMIRDDIIEVFSLSLKTFEFDDGQGNAMSFSNAIVEEIDFPASGYWGVLDYRISLKCYEVDYFKAQGIMDAIDEFQSTENENGTLTVSHRISARGFDYVDKAGVQQHGLSNAIAWVDSRKGSQHKSKEGIEVSWWGGSINTVGGLMGSGNNPPGNLKLHSQNETINRLTGVYEISETFMGYLDGENNIATRSFGRKFTVDINESLSADFNTVTISGQYLGGRDTSLDELRKGFVGDNPDGDPTKKAEPEKMLYEKAVELSGFDGSFIPANLPGGAPNPVEGAGKRHKPLLYSVPTGFSVEEDETNKTIKVKATFDTNSLFANNRYFFNSKISVSMDELTNVTKVTVSGNLEIRGLSIEKQFYLKKFLEGRDVMDFLWTEADAEHKKIGKTCWECKDGKYPAGHSDAGNAVDEGHGAGKYWIRADIGDDFNAANTICGNHPYKGIHNAGPERCHDLNSSATSLSMVKNEVNNTLALSATFNDEDTLKIKVEDPGDGTCFKCVYRRGGIKIISAADQAAADIACPHANPTDLFASAAPCGGGEISTEQDYGRSSFSVAVTSPIDYAKANASAQPQYNGHWAIQKFGIKTRERSNIKVDLQFREDAGVDPSYLEDTLRTQAKKIQDTLNGMLDQSYAGPAGGPVPSPVYDVSESVRHKVTKGDQITHSLERSYQPDEANAICIEIDPIGDQKDCFMCKDSGGDYVKSASLGDRVYVYPNSGYQAGVGYQYNQTAEAQALCDMMIGTLDVDGVSISGPLTVAPCENCWQCFKDNGEMIGQVSGADEATAEAACPSGGGSAVHVVACDLSVSPECYECWGGDGHTTQTYGPFETILPATAHDICTGYQGLPQYSDLVEEKICPPVVKKCHECFYLPGGGGSMVQGVNDYGWVVAEDAPSAITECIGVFISFYPTLPVPTASDIGVQEGCDFQTFGSTTTTTASP